MRNRYLSIAIAVSIYLLLSSGCKPINPMAQKEDHDKYDGPDKAMQFEFNRTKDPATGRVPRERYLTAMQQTIDNRLQTASLTNSPNSITSLSWTERGPNSDAVGSSNGNPRANSGITSGRIRAIMVDSSDATHKTVWIGGVDGGLWKTTDITASPATWTVVDDNLANLAIAAICQDPTNNQIMYFCTGESYYNVDAVQGNGVFKSIDGGSTWFFLPSTSSYVNGTRILCDYQGNVYLATRGTGLLRSTNGGSTWTNITPSSFTNSDICDMEISSTSGAGRLHVVCGIFSTQAYRYTDIPATVSSSSGWTAPATAFPSYAMRAEIACKGSTLYALPANTSYQVPTIYKSTDGGANWAATGAQPTSGWASGQGWYALAVDIDPSNSNNCIVGGLDTWKTTNGGSSWSQISTWVGTTPVNQYVHADCHKIVWFDGGNKLLFGCDGGLHYSSDKGATIRDRNTGLRIKQFYSCAIHPSTTNYFLAGAQDNGVHQFSNAGLSSTVEVMGGDGAFTAIDQDESSYQYGSYVYNQYERSTDGGVTWSSVNLSSANGQFINPFDFDNSANIMYCSDNAGAYRRWTDPHTGSTSAIVSITGFNSANVMAVTVSPYTSNRVYFGTDGGRVVRVDGANSIASGSAGTNLSTGLPSGTISCIAEGTSDNNLMCCYTNYGINSIWVSTNGGTSWTSLDNNGVNLPDMPVRWCMFYPGDNTKAFIATETGVWETNLINGTSTVWTSNSTFPIVRTDMLKYRSSDRTIAAATHGRGLWTATIPVSLTPDIQFEYASGTATESTTSTSGCRGYIDYTVNMSILAAPTGTATVTLGIAGASTATQNVDYAITTNGNFNSPSMQLTFANGSTTSQSLTIRVYDDAAVENTETIKLNYSISGVTNAQAGTANQVFTFSIYDNDNAPITAYTNTQGIGSFQYDLIQAAGDPLFNSKLASKRVQLLYKASELTAAGLSAGALSGMSFYIGAKNSTRAFSNLTIKMKGTTQSSLVNGGFTEVTGMTTVKNAFTYSTVLGYNDFTFDAAYNWNGTDNIAVEICYDNGTTAPSQTSDHTYGYADGSSASIGNMFWQDAINCSGIFTSVSNFGSGIKPTVKFSVSVSGTTVSTALNSTKSAYLGPNDDVYFYDGSGNILARIKNLTSFDYGCTAVTIDRAGSSSVQFWNNASANYLLSKSIKVVPTNNTASGSYQITLYYSAAEVTGWQTATGRTWSGSTMQVVKVSNGFYIPDVTASVPHSADVSVVTGTKGTINTDYTITGNFSSTGFSGFGAGVAGNAILNADFITKSSGNFSNGSIWQYNNEGAGYVDAGQSPSSDNNATIQAAHTVTLDANPTFNSGKTLTVNGTLDCGTNVISGAGTFTLASSATLVIGSTLGITGSGSSGNIQTTTRNFSSTANYSYNGLANQASGNGLPSTINNLIVNNTGPLPNNIVSLSNDLTVGGNSTLTSGALSINGKTLTLNGSVSGAGTISGSSGSSLVIGGSAGTINFDQTSAASRSLNNLTLNNGSSATLGTALDIYGTVALTSASLNLNAKNLTLKSNSSGTARIADLTGSTLSGGSNVTMERYIKLRNPGTGDGSGNYGRAYRLLTPTVNSSGTINANWQEGQMVSSIGGTANSNPGYGTHITGAGGNTNGFDKTQSNQPSLYLTTNGTSLNYTAVSNTNINNLNALTGYFLYVRGDRSVSTNIPLASNMPTTSTTLRATGTIKTGTQSVFTNAFSGVPGAMNLVTNPFPSPINWATIYADAATTNLSNYYTYWDPNVGTRGGFVTVTNGGIVSPTPSGGIPAGTITIQSGQAFFVTSTGGGTPTLSIKESHKTTGNNNGVFRITNNVESFGVSLYFNESGGFRRLADGVTTIYDNSFNKGLDENDAIEITNWDEDLAIDRDHKHLSIESRPVIQFADTMPLFIENLKQTTYQFEFRPQNFTNPLLKVELIDKYLNQRTLLSASDSMLVTFDVNADPGSFATDRFMIVFGAKGGTPIEANSSVKVFPNPIAGSSIQLQLNLQKGNYDVRLVNVGGQVVYKGQFYHSGGVATKTISIGKELAKGNYQLLIEGNGEKIVGAVLKN